MKLEQGFTLQVDQLRPASKGHVGLNSANPADKPAAYFNYLAEDHGVRELKEGFAKIEELIDEIKKNYTIAIVTHSMQQAARVSQRTAYFHLGKLIEVGNTKDVFTMPKHQLTENYITGRFG